MHGGLPLPRTCTCTPATTALLLLYGLVLLAVARNDEIASSPCTRCSCLPLDRATGRRHATVGRAGRLSRREISGLPRPA